MEKTEIVSRLREFVYSNFMLDPKIDNFTDDESLIAAGIVDSYGIVEMVSYIEETWGIKIGSAEVTKENFGSLNRISDYIKRSIR